MKRKHISWKKKYACALLALGDIPYAHAREMTADQMISLYHVDHGILHETENENVDQWWNLTPRLISAHRIKTKQDAKIIAKSRRIRARFLKKELEKHGLEIRPIPPVQRLLQIGEQELKKRKLGGWDAKRTIQSRGFDKTLRKKLSGKVERR